MTQTILLIEDNEDDAELTKRALKKCNSALEVIHLKDGAEAVQWLTHSTEEANAPKLDLLALILLDIKLPKLNGIEVLKQIRQNERTKLIPVVMLTSSKEEEDLINSYKNQCNSYITKPIEFTKFNDAVIQTGTYWLQLNQQPQTLIITNAQSISIKPPYSDLAHEEAQ
jgi:CheY-like chemotaxis protein